MGSSTRSIRAIERHTITEPERLNIASVKLKVAIARVLTAALLLTPSIAVSAEPEVLEETRHANRLVDSNSPYLLLHAHNPVDWYPWGQEAFEKARKEDKPIFLSVGYSTCFWCHVAERTLYSDPEIAELMNAWFVNVKVDREQRPDVDEIYMLARHLLTGSGGWPNNVVLTPDLKPFFAGSYFPPETDRLGRPGFPSVLRALHRAWMSSRETLRSAADQVAARMEAVRTGLAGNAGAVAIEPRELSAAARRSVLARFDDEHGGFLQARGGAKFPEAPLLELLLTDYRTSNDRRILRVLRDTLDAMAYGGVYDHLGGGFHRYSTERTWSIPHFEKMLYDNAQLLGVYASAFEATGRPLYRYMAEDIADYLIGRMMSPEGGFFTAEDAQIDGIEGVSYRWTREQIVHVLGARDAEAFFRVYELAPVPELPGATGVEAGDVGGVIRIRLPVDGTLGRAGFDSPTEMLVSLEPLRERLLAARSLRPQPLRDEKLNADLNGLAISALVRSGQILSRSEHIAAARKAADRIWRLSFDAETGLLLHQIFRGRADIEGYLSDYALLGSSLVALSRATGERSWLARAEVLAGEIIERFLHPDGALAMSTGEIGVFIPVESTGDSVYPSGTSAAIAFLLSVSAEAEDTRLADTVGRVLRRYSARLSGAPESWAVAVAALNEPDARSRTAIAAATAAADPSARTDRFRLQETKDHVRASAVHESGGHGDRVVVTLNIADGYHINANPATLDYLIPTTVTFAGAVPERVEYPPARGFKPQFSKETLDVYEGTAVIVASFAKQAFDGKSAIRGAVTAQACNEEVCLPPSKITVSAHPVR